MAIIIIINHCKYAIVYSVTITVKMKLHLVAVAYGVPSRGDPMLTFDPINWIKGLKLMLHEYNIEDVKVHSPYLQNLVFYCIWRIITPKM